MAFFKCNHCLFSTSVGDQYLNKKAKCPKCGRASPVVRSRFSKEPRNLTLNNFIMEYVGNAVGDGSFKLENDRTLRIDLEGEVWIKKGRSTAASGNVSFEPLDVKTNQKFSFFSRKARNKTMDLESVTGNGRLILTDAGKKIVLIDLDVGQELIVTGDNLLAFEKSIEWTVQQISELSNFKVAMDGRGNFCTKLIGPGRIALSIHNEPVCQPITKDNPFNVKRANTVAWSSELEMGYDPETKNLKLIGEGFVLLQSQEEKLYDESLSELISRTKSSPQLLVIFFLLLSSFGLAFTGEEERVVGIQKVRSKAEVKTTPHSKIQVTEQSDVEAKLKKVASKKNQKASSDSKSKRVKKKIDVNKAYAQGKRYLKKGEYEKAYKVFRYVEKSPKLTKKSKIELKYLMIIAERELRIDRYVAGKIDKIIPSERTPVEEAEKLSVKLNRRLRSFRKKNDVVLANKKFNNVKCDKNCEQMAGQILNESGDVKKTLKFYDQLCEHNKSKPKLAKKFCREAVKMEAMDRGARECLEGQDNACRTLSYLLYGKRAPNDPASMTNILSHYCIEANFVTCPKSYGK